MTALDFPVHQEPEEIEGRPLLRIGVVATFIGAVGVFFAGLIVVASAGALRPSAAGPQGVQPGPKTIARIFQTPIWDSQEGIDLQARQRAQLHELRWANRAGGMARIPIEDAMDLVVREAR
jgi:hypothetical protein